jgi:hypothetical protein
MTHEQLVFDFHREVQKDSNFDALFPGEQPMRAMLWIYGRMSTGAIPNDRFREDLIYTAFQETSHGVYQRIPASSFNGIISGLQKYFLRYDEDEQVYTFRDYGKNIFSIVETTLSGSFNPTEIEIICSKLKEDLIRCESPEALESWMQLNFAAFIPRMNTQVDNLDRYIDTTVVTIREMAQLQDGDAVETLKNIDMQLEKVRQYNGELKIAFSSMKEINRELNGRIHGVNSSKLLDSIERVRQFFPHVKYRLELIDKRLDRLQPRLRQFFSALNKPLFNTKVEKFLRLLIANSQLDGVQKNVRFPLEIPSLKIYQSTPNFTIVERKEDLFPPMARRRPGTDHSPEHVQSVHKGLNEKVVLQSRIDKCVKAILDDCRLKQEVLLSEYFFRIIDEQKSLELAVRVAHRLVRQIPYRREFKFIVDKSNRIKKNGITIWEMKISICQ